MTHEFKKIINAYNSANNKGLKTVMATVVALDGSSYRRPGVRMLIREDGKMIGAVSGGCVEKEVCRQSERVFKDGKTKLMTYDGRYRLGCEGILYILIEIFEPSRTFINTIEAVFKNRESFIIVSHFMKTESTDSEYGSLIIINEDELPFREGLKKNETLQSFEQKMLPCFKLMILGAEHDAVQLCSFAALTGWEVSVVVPPSEGKVLTNFPGADELLSLEPETLPVDSIDDQTAIVIMTHSYVKDLKFLLQLINSKPAYLGMLGPFKRREKLLGEVIDYYPDAPIDLFERIHGPAGLNIGGETAQEIAIAIMGEILAVIRGQDPIMLRDKEQGIHE